VSLLVLRRLVAELLGTALLVAAVVGSGIAATRLSPGEVELQLLENSTATAAELVGGALAVAAIGLLYPRPAAAPVDTAVPAGHDRLPHEEVGI
jgi:glycerol uptake facilitator-like aquaporin